jgi:hypothetical protein
MIGVYRKQTGDSHEAFSLQMKTSPVYFVSNSEHVLVQPGLSYQDEKTPPDLIQTSLQKNRSYGTIL